MSSWDEDIFTDEANVEFLDELSALEDEEIVAAVDDACALAVSGEDQTEEEQRNALAAATIAAIWAGAPFSAGETADTYPFLRTAAADVDEKLVEAAVAILEDVDSEQDVDQFIEALS